MIEYKGWDDYVNRKRTDERLKQMVTPLHQANVIGRIEALEEWRSKQHVGDLFHHGVEEELEDRVKELEEWKISQLGWISRLQEIEKQIEELKDGEHIEWHGKDESYHEERIKKLEERTNKFELAFADGGVMRRVHKLEEWKNRYDVDFTHDFQWKTSALERVESLEHRVQELEGYPVGAPSALTTRVKRLEEWKQDICNWGDKKVIDKQDWEYIKESVSNLIGVVHAEPGSRYDVLIKAIQKVDPEFCPND